MFVGIFNPRVSTEFKSILLKSPRAGHMFMRIAFWISLLLASMFFKGTLSRILSMLNLFDMSLIIWMPDLPKISEITGESLMHDDSNSW